MTLITKPYWRHNRLAGTWTLYIHVDGKPRQLTNPCYLRREPTREQTEKILDDFERYYPWLAERKVEIKT